MQMVNFVLKNFESPINGEIQQPFTGEATNEPPLVLSVIRMQECFGIKINLFPFRAPSLG